MQSDQTSKDPSRSRNQTTKKINGPHNFDSQILELKKQISDLESKNKRYLEVIGGTDTNFSERPTREEIKQASKYAKQA